ncbi:MAG TPA: thioesterase, partial [Chloroflexia bacterium]|nr:thioesterase [Chloroflexia bacterium]
MKDLPPELTGRFDLRVEAQHTAAAMGNTHMEVLATPYVVWMIEAAASRAVAPYLDDGEGAAGTQITLRHLAPTAVGRVAIATIRL